MFGSFTIYLSYAAIDLSSLNCVYEIVIRICNYLK